MKKVALTIIDVFNLITGKDGEKADELFDKIYGEQDRYDDFVAFYDENKFTKEKKLIFQ